MTDITRVIAVLEDGSGLEARVVPANISRNAIKKLGKAVVGGQSVEENAKWHEDSLDLLNNATNDDTPHATSPGTDTPPSGANTLDTPWYGIFEDNDGDLWVLRFFGPDLAGESDLRGIFVPPDDYEDDAGDWLSGLTEDMRPKRSLLVRTRNDITAAQGRAKDHGGGGGNADGSERVRDEWPIE